VTIPVPYEGSYLDRPMAEEELKPRTPEPPPALPQTFDELMAEARFRAENSILTFEVGPDQLNPWVDATLSDPAPPSVIFTDPPSDATDVATSTKILATFSKYLDDVAMTVRDSSGAEVAGEASLALGDLTAVFTPRADLPPGTTFTVEITRAQGTVGDPMTTPYTWRFTTTA
jgi:hypothetical protein